MDNIWISLDNEGSVVAVSQLLRGSANCENGLSKGDVDALDEFNTDVVLRHAEAAPIPDTASFIQKMERERESREKGETKDTRGFFAKYVSGVESLVICPDPSNNLISPSSSGCTLCPQSLSCSFPVQPIQTQPQPGSRGR